MTIFYLPLIVILTISARLEDSQSFTGRAAVAPVPDLLQPQIAAGSEIASDPLDSPVSFSPPKNAPDEIYFGSHAADGIAIELFTSDNPLELINPAAPERYGSADDNVVRDIRSNTVSGLKLFEWRF